MVPAEKPESIRQAQFPETLWSKVLAVRIGSPAEAHEALAELCQGYWHPLYAFIRVRGYPPPDAQDLTQSFFAFLLSRNSLHNAERDRGRFRTFLLACLDHFLLNEWKKGQTEKRGGKQLILSWDEVDEAGLDVPVQDAPPEKLYDRNWAASLVTRVLDALQKEYGKVGKVQHFEVLRAFLPGSLHSISHLDAASRLQITRAAFDVALGRFKRRFGHLLRAEVAQTVATPAEIDDELQYLLSAWTVSHE